MERIISIDDAIKFFNELINIDEKAVVKLINYRVECNKEIANHPTVQVGERIGEENPCYDVSWLGIINGLFGVDEETGYGYICAEVKMEGNDQIMKIKEFRRTDLAKVKENLLKK